MLAKKTPQPSEKTVATHAAQTPLFKDLSDDALRAEYLGYRALAYNTANMAASGAVNRHKAAAQMGRLMKNIQIIEAIARQRRISLVQAR